MPALHVEAFDGIIPRTAPSRLALRQAQIAQNVKLYSGELRYWQGPTLAYSPVSITARSIYRLYGSSSSIWLTWTQTGVDVAPGPISDTTDFRIYYTGAGSGPAKTNYAMASSAAPYPTAWLNMGVPAPTAAPTVSSSSHAAPVEYRVYVYTYLSTFGALTEESAPSPASAIVGVDVPGTTVVTVNGFSAAPTTNYNITGINIYRSVSGATTTNYEFVATIPITTTTYADTLTTLQLGQVLPTVGWTPPPAGMKGIISTGINGCLAGFAGNTVYFSQPFAPHAWPLAYALSTPYNIVGLAVTDGYVVVMTTRYPYLISGVTPGAMTMQQLPNDEPCLSRSTITSDQNGVLYASPNGLVSIGSGGAAVITNGLYRRTDWQAINPGAMRSVAYDGKYFGVLPGPNKAQSIVISGDDIPSLSTLTLHAASAYKDSITGNLYVVDYNSGNIYQVDSDPNNPLPYVWHSKRFVTPQATALSAMKVDANFDQIIDDAPYQELLAEIIAYNQAAFASGLHSAVDDSTVNTMAVNGSTQIPLPPPNAVRTVSISLYGDEVLIGTFNINSFDPIRLPAFKARVIEFEVTGNIFVTSVTFATTMRELDPQSAAVSMQNPPLWQ